MTPKLLSPRSNQRRASPLGHARPVRPVGVAGDRHLVTRGQGKDVETQGQVVEC